MADTPADWYPDPLGRHEYRYWDGSRWTEHVADEGQASVDPISSAAPASASERSEGSLGGAAVLEPERDEREPESGGTGAAGAGVREMPGEQVVARPEPTPTRPATTAGAGVAGVRSDLLDATYAEQDSGDRVVLQNSKMLKINLGPDVLARQGAMVAFQGSIDFDYEGSGGMGRFLKKAMTGEGVPLMRCSGSGELFLANDADDVHLLWLDGGSGVTVNGRNILAFDHALEWDIERVQGASMFAGGLFNTVLRGTGWVAITTHGTPVALRTDTPTFADTDAAVAWSNDLQTSLNRTFKTSSLIGRGSGELAQLSFTGRGFVVVQASEGPTVPPHNHGS